MPYRDLLRLRRELPALITDLVVRPFTEIDAEAFLECNNRAFDWHPEQGEMTPETSPPGRPSPGTTPRASCCLKRSSRGRACNHRLLLDQGACRRKARPREIYAIAVDPEHHGRGLGRELTLAGLPI
ncbi:MAG: hypothetical protein CM1200mP26_15520 [Acidimicrobiales bacterium]|nr:MAG: hypothetical protein CM1200mP26_15520 [Acidimicrobiales bacterium]